MINKLRTAPAKKISLLLAMSVFGLFSCNQNTQEQPKLTETTANNTNVESREDGTTNPDTSRDSEGDTFSIVAYDKTTGEVGGAACSCVSWSGGIDFLSDLITDGTNNPDNIVGAIHSQAAYNSGTQTFARNRMLAGDTPQEIIDATVAADGSSASRQYGVVGVDVPGAAGFSGSSNGDYKNDQQGDNALYTYSIQGNILDTTNGQDLLDDMEAIFNSTDGTLGDKLMAALQAAKRVGGDSRCQSRGNSGRTAFIQVLAPGETTPGLAYDIGDTTAAVNDYIEPIDVLQCLYDIGENTPFCRQTVSTFPYTMDFEQKSWEQEVATCSVNSSWIRSRFATPTSGTGPSGASQGTLYAFVESSNVGGQGTSPRSAMIGSPCLVIPVGETTIMSFDYHMSGTNMGSLDVTVNDGGGWTSEWTRSGNQGSNWNSSSIDLSAYAGSTIKIRIDATTGNGELSDMAVDNIQIYQEGPVNCASSINTFPYTESLEGNIGDWQQATGDDGNWSENTGGTPSSNTGPSDSSYGASYIYLESSDPAATGQPTAIGFNATAILESPCFDLTTMPAAYFNFDYHMYGATSGSLTLQASSVEGVWANIFSVSGLDVNDWTPTSVNLSDYLGGNVRLRFVGVTGSSFTSDIALDSFVLSSCNGLTKTWKDNAWSTAGSPTGNNPILIDDTFSTNTSGNLDGCFVEVNSGSTLTVDPNTYISIDGNISIEGTLIVAHTANVVQTDDNATVTNNGTINVNITTPVLQTRDFMVLGSPMDSETRNDVFTNAFLVLNNNPGNFIPHPDVGGGTNFADDNGDYWTAYTGNINVGEGYIVRPQDGYTDPANESYDMTYSEGTLNNGTITKGVIFNNLTDNPQGTPNAISNPYPSAISGYEFIDQNNLVNEIYFWEHLTPPGTSIPGSNSINFSMGDISMYNLSGGTKASNDSGTSTTPNGVISTGQGFSFRTLETGNVLFNNGMRLTSGNSTLRSRNEEDVDKIWINIRSVAYGIESNTLLAFNPDANATINPGFDSERVGSFVSLYTYHAETNSELGIQTTSAFDPSMKFALGYETQVAEGTLYEISIDQVVGQRIENTKVFLHDFQEGITTELSATNYEFRSNATNTQDRFTIFFKTDEEVLGTNDQQLNTITVYPNPTKDILHIISTREPLEQVEIYDVRGRLMQQDIEGEDISINVSSLKAGVYFVKIFTESGSTTKKIIKN